MRRNNRRCGARLRSSAERLALQLAPGSRAGAKGGVTRHGSVSMRRLRGHRSRSSQRSDCPMPEHPLPQRGRGAPVNPPNRFEPLWYSRDPEWSDPEDPALETQFFKDTSRSIITYNDSPDVGFDASINPYRGCEHGCIYCLSGDTLILMADETTRRLEDVRIGDACNDPISLDHFKAFLTSQPLRQVAFEATASQIPLASGSPKPNGCV
jgi:hypothetical protein